MDSPPAQKPDDQVKINRELRKKVGSRAMNYVSRLHKELGSPIAGGPDQNA